MYADEAVLALSRIRETDPDRARLAAEMVLLELSDHSVRQAYMDLVERTPGWGKE